MSIPDQIYNPDWFEVKDLARQEFERMCSGEECDDNDMMHYIAESVITALYGKNAFHFASEIAAGKTVYSHELEEN